MAENLLGALLGSALGSIDDQDRVIVALELAALDVLDPSVVDDLADGGTLLGVGVEHHQQHPTQRGWVDHHVEWIVSGVVVLGNGCQSIRVFGVPLVERLDQFVVLISLVLRIVMGLVPQIGTKYERNQDDGGTPDVEASGVVFLVLGQHLGGDVGLATADARIAQADFAHLSAALSAGLSGARMYAGEDFRDAEVCNLQLAVLGDEQVLELDVPMCDAVSVQVVQALQQLLEQAQAIAGAFVCLQVLLLDETEQVTL